MNSPIVFFDWDNRAKLLSICPVKLKKKKDLINIFIFNKQKFS